MIRTKRCPACQRENAIIDLHCDCGRNFATGQHDLLYGVRAGRVEATWPIPGRGYRRIELDAAMLTARIGGD